MKISLLILAFILSSNTYSCPKIKGTWQRCDIKTELLNSFELFALNIALKSYRFTFDNPEVGKFKSIISKVGLFSGREIILEELSIIGEQNHVTWEGNILEGSTPPVLLTSYMCTNNGMIEEITWKNLSVANYPDHAHRDFPQYYKSIYRVSANRLTRRLMARNHRNDFYQFMGSITCYK